jgi:hypothetical protein
MVTTENTCIAKCIAYDEITGIVRVQISYQQGDKPADHCTRTLSVTTIAGFFDLAPTNLVDYCIRNLFEDLDNCDSMMVNPGAALEVSYEDTGPD